MEKYTEKEKDKIKKNYFKDKDRNKDITIGIFYPPPSLSEFPEMVFK